MNLTARIASLHQRIALRALASIRTPRDARILNVVRTGTVITVVTHQDDARLPYCVDSFRLLTTVEKDPEEWEPYPAPDFTLVDQYGGVGVDELPGMLASAIAFARTVAA